MAGVLKIRPVTDADREEWEPLWQGYLTFYEAELPPGVTDATWRRFLDPVEPMHAVVAEIDGSLTGLAHYLLHRSTWAPECYCYLEDLFVPRDWRGHGIGRALIGTVERAAVEAHATRLYWSTHHTNTQAQILYDKLAERSGFIQYRKRLEPTM
jgi:GNAT superfamily N-acetyltransferase